jgi:hypothetical protein
MKKIQASILGISTSELEKKKQANGFHYKNNSVHKQKVCFCYEVKNFNKIFYRTLKC